MKTTALSLGFGLLLMSVALLLVSCGTKGTGEIASSGSEPLLVSAASSLTDVMNAVGTAFTKKNPQTIVRFNFAASGALQQQIEQGAPVDVFASASPKEMDALAQKSLLEPQTRHNFAGNTLVLIVRSGSPVKGWADLSAPSVKKVALSNPDSVPSGRYARETLTTRGLWAVVAPKTVLGENVRQTLTYVANGDVEAGIVFATDAIGERDKVQVVAQALAGKDHKPIIYPAAVVAHSVHKQAAKQFVDFLLTPSAQALFSQYGFTPPPAQK